MTAVQRVVMLGAFPPPIGGAPKVNGIMFEALRAAGMAVDRIDVSASSLSHTRSFGYHLKRLRRNLMGALDVGLKARMSRVLYIVPDGGHGGWYTLGHLRAARQRYGRTVIHHHTYRYISMPTRVLALIKRAAPDAVHVFLSQGMADGFSRAYGPVRHVIASNARFVAEEAMAPPEPARAERIRIGHLSNLCREKGFYDVADTFDMIRAAGADAELVLAGPILEPGIEERLTRLRRDHGDRVHHSGPIDGAEKAAFYRSLDVFLFPTHFAQEAAPMVCYEALAAGVPVIANDRGAIAEVVAGVRGIVCAPSEAFDVATLAFLNDTPFDPDHRARRAASIKASIRAECDRSTAQFNSLMALLGVDEAAAPLIGST